MRRVLSALAGMCLMAPAWCEPSFDTLRISEASLHTFVLRKAEPACQFPADAESSQGVVVAEVELSSTGRLISTAILEAPTLSIAQCVRRTLLMWTFRAIGGKPTSRYSSKVTFYSVVDGKGDVVWRHTGYSEDTGFSDLDQAVSAR